MKKSIILTSLLAMGVAMGASAQAIEGAPDGYKLVWSDEFDGTALNEKIWNIEVSGSGGGNQELQYYRRENVSVEDGNLVLTARREDFEGKAFTSGRVNSNQKAAFKHGIIQARVKFPMTANGLWPAYWMMGNDINKYGWPRCGEIDIVEMGHYNAISGVYKDKEWQDRYFSGTLHYGPSASNSDHQMNSQEFSAEKFETLGTIEGDYHIFTLEWNGNYLYMYYDLEGYNNARKNRARYYTLDVSPSDDNMSPGKYFQKPFYFLFNLAVGGTFPGIYDPSGITALPNAGDEAKMLIDWVRVYQADDDADAQYLYTDENGNKQTNIEEEPDKPSQPDDKTELSGFATKALDDEGNTTFDFNDVSDAVLISTSDGVRGHLYEAGANVTDYNVNNSNRNMYIWDNTYVPVNRDGKTNSFGWDEGYNKFTVGSAGWSGLGFNIQNEDLSMIDDDYWFHFAMKGDDPEQHTSHQVTVSNANFMVGNSDGKYASVGDFKRDGNWYYFDIPVKVLRQFSDPVLKEPASSFNDNIVAFLSGGVNEAEISIDNIFFYKSKSKETPNYQDTSADLGKYGYKSIGEDGTWAFDIGQVGEMIPLQLSEDVWRQVTADGSYGEGSLVKSDRDYTQNNNYYTWEGTMKGEFVEGVANSTGIGTGGISTWASTGGSWDGMGIATATRKDLSMIDDSYYLHIALRSEEAVSHIPVRVRFGAENNDASLTFGSYSTKAIFADFGRDGEWYAFDIPVAELKKYGNLWGKDGGVVNVGDNLLCFYTADTQYSGSSFAFDNIFFWKSADESVPPAPKKLGDYGYKSLNEQGETDFTFDDKDFINFSVASATLEMQTEDNILAGYYTLYNWDGTYNGNDNGNGDVNSFGIANQGWIDWVVAEGKGWSGGGTIDEEGADLTVLDEGDWYLHFAMRGTDGSNHLIGFAGARFTIGSTPFDGDTPVVGNYERDNEWYSFDIPLSYIRSVFPSLFAKATCTQSAWTDNLVWFMSGGHPGDELQLDNVFLWRQKTSTDIAAHHSSAHSQQTPQGIFTIDGRKVGHEAQGGAIRGGSLPRGIYIVRTAAGMKKVLVK